MNQQNKAIYFSLVAGLFGSFSSIFGKLSTDTTQTFLKNCILFFSSSEFVLIVARILCFIINILCTGIMWTYFVESLQNLSALTATVLNTCSNFISTGIFGYLIFGETLTLKWFFGISVILMGISLIVSGEKNKDE
eukprot:gene10353-2767_t